MKPQKRDIIFEFHPGFSLFILDRLLGGSGNTKYNSCELTQIEQKIMRKIVNAIMKIFQSAWEKTIKFDLNIQNYYSRGDHLQFARKGDNVVSIVFHISIDDDIQLKNALNITYPFFLIDELIPSALPEDSEPLQKSSNKEKVVMQNKISEISTPVTVGLGKSMMSLDELTKLQIGDIVMLDRRPQDNLDMNVGQNAVFRGQAGVLKNKMAFRITHKCSK